ncbi:hypothetical protein Tco_0641419, partial [Tanacetum coccineum]
EDSDSDGSCEGSGFLDALREGSSLDLRILLFFNFFGFLDASGEDFGDTCCGSVEGGGWVSSAAGSVNGSLMTSNNVTFIASFIPCLRKKYRLNLKNDMPPRVTMTKVIKEEFEKLESLKIDDVSLTCKTPLEIFHEEFNRMSRMDDDLFTYEVEISRLADIPCDLKEEEQMSHESDDGMEYDISNARGDDEVELTDEESSDSDEEDEVAVIFRIETNVFDFETPTCRAFKEFNYLLQIDPDVLTKDIDGFKTYKDYKDDWIYERNKDVLWVHEKPWMDDGVWKEPTPVVHYYEPFNYKNGCSEWPTCSWRDDGYCNGGNLPGAYIIGNALRYQDFKWYEALEDGKLKEEALKNKAIMEGIIEDEEDESCNEDWRR